MPQETIQANLDAARRRRDRGFLGDAARFGAGVNGIVQTLGGAFDEDLFQAHDFLFGPTPEDQKSDFRQASEAQAKTILAEAGPIAGFTRSVGQFAFGMVGLGKLTAGMKALPWVGRGVTALGDAIEGSKVASMGAEAVKAATVANTMFDPHAEGLSNLLIQYPLLNNGVTRLLAHQPGETDAEGRLRNTLESLGMDAGAGLFVASLRLFKALGAGDRAAIEAATKEVQQAQPTAQGVPAPKVQAEGGPVTVEPAQGAFAGEPKGVPIPPPPKPETAAELKARFTGPDGAVNLGQASDALSQEAQAALDAGRKVTIYVEGKPIPIVSVDRGMMADAKGQRWGMLPLISKADMSEPAFEIGPAVSSPPGAPAAKPRVSVKADLGAEVPDVTPKQFLDAAEGKAHDGPPGEVVPTADAGTGAPVPPRVLDGAPAPEHGGSRPESPSVPAGRERPQGEAGVPSTPEGLTPGTRADLPKFDQATVRGIISAVQKDWDALHAAGMDWQAATEAGHKFASSPNSVPYNKMGSPDDVDAFVRQAARALDDTGWLANAKGGDVLKDATVQARLAQWKEDFNLDPALMMAKLQEAGNGAREMVVQMEAGYLAANRMFQDATVAAKAIVAGDFARWGGNADLAHETVQQHLVAATKAMGHANSIRAAAGRAVRRNRSEFLPTPADIAALRAVNGDMLAQLLSNARGNVKNLPTIVRPSTWSKLTDLASFIFVNNLVGGWRTQVVNFLSNSFVMAHRPFERIVGAAFMGKAGLPIMQQSLRQYAYMTTSLVDGFKAGVDSFIAANSRITPHSVELYRTTDRGTPGLFSWKPPTSVPNVIYNGLVGALTVGKAYHGIPSRLLGAADETMKVITYRSLVSAKAYMEARTLAEQQGITGAAKAALIKQTVEDRVAGAFDDMGRATDMDAKQEAQIATFSQELAPNTLGKTVQGYVANHPTARLIVPFVRTVDNILRYGLNLTPGLNAIQADFRARMAGKVGDTPAVRAFNRAQARGQFGLSLAYTLAGAAIVAGGGYTGGGPADRKAKRDLMDTGWQPYSRVIHNDDGSVTYDALAGRMDPIAIPLGIIADIGDAIDHPEGGAVDKAATALVIALAKQIANKTYLLGLSNGLDAVMDPQPAKTSALLGNMAANLVPGKWAYSQFNTMAVDDTMRDARSIMDRVLATMPGLSADLPARRDVWGDPVHVRQAWRSTSTGFVDQEMERLIMETDDGKSIAGVLPNHQDADLRDVTMVDGRNAYDRLQELSGHLPGAPALKDLVAKVMQTPAYHNAPDGAARLKGTKLYMLGSVINPYHDKAMKVLRQDPNVRQALYADEMKVRAAYAAQQRDPQGAIPQTKALNNILEGVGLPSVQLPSQK